MAIVHVTRRDNLDAIRTGGLLPKERLPVPQCGPDRGLVSAFSSVDLADPALIAELVEAVARAKANGRSAIVNDYLALLVADGAPIEWQYGVGVGRKEELVDSGFLSPSTAARIGEYCKTPDCVPWEYLSVIETSRRR